MNNKYKVVAIFGKAGSGKDTVLKLLSEYPRYKPIISYTSRPKRENEREKMAGITLFGVHRDDIEIMINGKSARSFSSQGQQRSIVLALKLSEGEVNREICGEYPIFLFDDVLSELDEKRKEYIMSGIGERQIIITSCEPDEKSLITNNKIKVEKGLYLK